MRGRRGERQFQLGEFWLSHDPKSPEIWCVTWYDAQARQTRRRSTGTSDLERAQLALAQHVVLNTTLQDERPEDIQIAVVLDRYYEKHAKDLPSGPGTVKPAIERWKQWWGDKTIADLTIPNQDAFERWLRKQTYVRGKQKPRTLSPGAVARIWNVGPTAFEWARKAQEIKWYPAVRWLQDKTRRKRILSIEEIIALFNAAADSEEHLWRWLLLAFATAARPNAPLDICLPMVDLENKRLDLLPPGKDQDPKKRRPIVPIVPTLLPWIRQWMQPERLRRTMKRGRHRGKVIHMTHLITYRGERLQKIRTGFDTLKRRAGITDPLVIPYSIRHTMTTWFMQRRPKVDEWDREVWLGHKSPGSQTTAGYVHLDPEYLQSATEAVEALFDAIAPHVKKPIKVGVLRDVRSE